MKKASIVKKILTLCMAVVFLVGCLAFNNHVVADGDTGTDNTVETGNTDGNPGTENNNGEGNDLSSKEGESAVVLRTTNASYEAETAIFRSISETSVYFQNKDMTENIYNSHNDSKENAINLNKDTRTPNFYNEGVLNVTNSTLNEGTGDFTVVNTTNDVTLKIYVKNGVVYKITGDHWYGQDINVDFFSQAYITEKLNDFKNKIFMAKDITTATIKEFDVEASSGLLAGINYDFSGGTNTDKEFGFNENSFSFGEGGCMSLGFDARQINLRQGSSKKELYEALKLTLNAGGGTFSDNTDEKTFDFPKFSTLSEYHAFDSSLELVPTKKDSAFIGWFDGENRIDESTQINSSVTLTAKWVEAEQKENVVPTDGLDEKQKEVASAIADETTNINIAEFTNQMEYVLDENAVLEAEKKLESDVIDIVVETYVEMKVEAVTPAADGTIQTFVVDITPYYMINAYKPGDKTTSCLIKKPEKLNLVGKEVDMTINLPDSFPEGATVWVKHDGKVLTAKVQLDNGKRFINIKNDKGFSEFTISLNELYDDVTPEKDTTPQYNLPKTGIE